MTADVTSFKNYQAAPAEDTVEISGDELIPMVCCGRLHLLVNQDGEDFTRSTREEKRTSSAKRLSAAFQPGAQYPSTAIKSG